MKDKTQQEYLPGQCNIGPAEIKKRMRIGYAGLAMIILFIIACELFQMPKGFKLLLFIPSVYALSGFLQARQKFCYVYGIFGLFSITGKRHKILQPEQLGKDRIKSLWLILQILLGGLLITLIYYSLG